MSWLYFSIAGFFSGIIAGMGMGGGTLLIPVLTLLLNVQQHAAQGINVVAFIPAAVVALAVHKKEGRLDLKECIPVIIMGAVSAAAASFLAGLIDSQWLRRIFGIFLVLLAAFRVISSKTKK